MLATLPMTREVNRGSTRFCIECFPLYSILGTAKHQTVYVNTSSDERLLIRLCRSFLPLMVIPRCGCRIESFSQLPPCLALKNNCVRKGKLPSRPTDIANDRMSVLSLRFPSRFRSLLNTLCSSSDIVWCTPFWNRIIFFLRTVSVRSAEKQGQDKITYKHCFRRWPFFTCTTVVDEVFPIVFYYHINVRTVRAKFVRFIEQSDSPLSKLFSFHFTF